MESKHKLNLSDIDDFEEEILSIACLCVEQATQEYEKIYKLVEREYERSFSLYIMSMIINIYEGYGRIIIDTLGSKPLQKKWADPVTRALMCEEIFSIVVDRYESSFLLFEEGAPA